jgi:hypothetical protein
LWAGDFKKVKPYFISFTLSKVKESSRVAGFNITNGGRFKGDVPPEL